MAERVCQKYWPRRNLKANIEGVMHIIWVRGLHAKPVGFKVYDPDDEESRRPGTGLVLCE